MTKAEFRPALDNPRIIRAAQHLAAPVARLWRRVVAISVPEQDLDRLRVLRSHRFLLCSNHPTLGDPLVILDLSRRVPMTLNGMTARELFQGPVGWLFQRMGAYSVKRGAPDREAIRYTRRLLAEEDRRIVVFPEGVTYGHNDLLLPFQSGVIQIGFWALEDIEKLGKEISLPIVPIAIKYLVIGDAGPVIVERLAALERDVGLLTPSANGFYMRLRTIGEQVMGRLEREIGLAPAPEASLADRIAAAKDTLLEHVARELNAHPPAGATTAERMHFLDNALAAYLAKPPGSSTPYERRLHTQRRERAAPLAADLRRVYNFLAVSDSYVASGLTVERFLEVLSRLEIEVRGRAGRRLPSRAVLRVGDVLELGEFLPAYRENKRTTVNDVTAALQQRIQALLEPLSAMGTPLVG